MPTETVYGLAGDARDSTTVARIFAAKRRPAFDPLIVHVADLSMAEELADWDAAARNLAKAFWPGPLTLILPRKAGIPDLVTNGMPGVGLRCPDHPLALELIRSSGLPLAAPSANCFGGLSPTTAAAVAEQLGPAVDMILDGGPCRVGLESTVLALQPEPLILRPGGVPPAALAEVLGRPVAIADSTVRAASLQGASPGMLASHYAPRQPLRLLAEDENWPTDPAVGRLLWRRASLPDGGPTRWLSEDGDLVQAAAGLFEHLRALDAAASAGIVTELVPSEGLGIAINDRLRRAAGLG